MGQKKQDDRATARDAIKRLRRGFETGDFERDPAEELRDIERAVRAAVKGD